MGKRLIEQLKELFSSLNHFIRQNPLGFLSLLLFLGWIAYTVWVTANNARMGLASKTFWDWMELLVVPAALATAGFWFTYVQKQTELETAAKTRELEREIAEKEREIDREIALERQQQQTLENYLDRMKELLLDRNLGSEATPEVKRLARTWTLIALRELTAQRNRQVIQFLQESELLGEIAIVDLSKADLANTDLREANLTGVNLSKANLNKANLNKAELSEANLSGADLRQAALLVTNLREADLRGALLMLTNLSGANLYKANLRSANLSGACLYKAHLDEANLRGAFLRATNLIGTNLSRANLEGASLLEEVNLSGANLRKAIVTDEQLSLAILSNETIMPDGSTYLEWKRKQEPNQEKPANEIQAADETVATDEARERLAEPAPEDNQELVPNEFEETISNSSER